MGATTQVVPRASIFDARRLQYPIAVVALLIVLAVELVVPARR